MTKCISCGLARMCQCGKAQRFIRHAAIELAVAFRMRDPIVSMSADDCRIAWAAARLLWDTKPEDC